MKKIIICSSLLFILINLIWFGFFKDYEPENFTGIYVDFSINGQENPLPKKMRWLPVADYLEVCDKVDKGWCKLSQDSATATPKGYMDNLLVRTFYLKDIKEK